MTATISPPLFIQFVLPTGPAAGYKLFHYIAGTSTKQNAFTDYGAGTPVANPLTLDANGAAIVWLDPTKLYKRVLAPPNDTDPPSSPVYTEDNVESAITSSILTQQFIGLILYPRTTAEIAASVTPTNYVYPPGHVYRYGANSSPGTTDMTTALNNALKSNFKVYAPADTYLVTSSILVKDYTELYGDGYGTVIKATTDIEIVASANADANSLVSIYLHDFKVQSTVTSASSPTKYQIHLRNPIISTLQHLWVQSGLSDTAYSSTNKAGIWIEDKNPAIEGPYINRFIGLFVQNGGFLADSGATDSTIIDCFLYGHCAAHSLKFNSAGGNWAVIGCNITSPPNNAGIWVNGGNENQFRFIGNFFDGNPTVLDSGHGIQIDSALRVLIEGNHIWAMSKSAIVATDPVVLTIIGNIFQNCNDEDNSNPDVQITGSAFQPTSVISSFNQHQQETSRTNKGLAIKEVNAGFNPVQCVYEGNVISANYLTTGNFGAIKTLQVGIQAAHVLGNSGGGTETEIYDSYTGTLTGCTTSPTGTVVIFRDGNQVSLTIPTSLTATSNSTACTITGMPNAYKPAAAQSAFAIITDNSVNESGSLTVETSGVLTLHKGSLGNFTAANTKGVLAGATITYQLT